MEVRVGVTVGLAVAEGEAVTVQVGVVVAVGAGGMKPLQERVEMAITVKSRERILKIFIFRL